MRKIVVPKIPKERIKFSFRFYDNSSTKYCLSESKKKKLTRDILMRLREISRLTYSEMKSGGDSLHFHPVKWHKTIEKRGFPCKEANQMEAFQFSVNGKIRIFGAFSQHIFHIVWFDLEHAIDPCIKKHS